MAAIKTLEVLSLQIRQFFELGNHLGLFDVDISRPEQNGMADYGDFIRGIVSDEGGRKRLDQSQFRKWIQKACELKVKGGDEDFLVSSKYRTQILDRIKTAIEGRYVVKNIRSHCEVAYGLVPAEIITLFVMKTRPRGKPRIYYHPQTILIKGENNAHVQALVADKNELKYDVNGRGLIRLPFHTGNVVVCNTKKAIDRHPQKGIHKNATNELLSYIKSTPRSLLRIPMVDVRSKSGYVGMVLSFENRMKSGGNAHFSAVDIMKAVVMAEVVKANLSETASCIYNGGVDIPDKWTVATIPKRQSTSQIRRQFKTIWDSTGGIE